MKNIIVICGFSSLGKDTILNELIKRNANLYPIVSQTSRPKRERETDGLEYEFISKLIS